MLKHLGLLLLLSPSLLFSQEKSGELRQSYLAHIAAANAAMRLNEPLEMQRWLKAAPVSERGWEWQFLQNDSDASIEAYQVEGEKPVNLSLSPDGQTFALPMPDGSVELRDSRTFNLKMKLKGHRKVTYAAAFNATSGQLATCSRDSSIRLWDLKTGAEIWSVPSGGQSLAVLASSADGGQLAFGSWFRTAERGVVGLLRLLDARTGAELWRTEFGVKPILGLAFSANGNRLAAGNWDGQVGIWDLEKPNETPLVLDYTGCRGYTAIDDLAFSPDGAVVVSATKCGEPRLWDAASGKLLTDLRGHRQAVMAVAFSQDGRYVFTGGDEGVLHTWDAATGNFLAKQFGHAGRITRIVTAPDNKELFTLSDDKTIRRWKVRAGLVFDDPRGRGKATYAFDLSADGKTLAFGGPDGHVSRWNLGDGALINLVKCFDDAPNALAFSPDGRRFVAVNWSKTAKIWDAATGNALQELEGVLEGGSAGCAWSPDGRFVASASRKNFVYLWDATTGRLLEKLERSSGCASVKFSPDSKQLAAGGNDGKITVWETNGTGTALRKTAEWQAHQADAQIYSLSFSPDGKRLVSGSEDRMAIISSFPEGIVQQKLEGHAQRIWSVAWSPDSSRIATASADLSTCLWDAQTAERMLTISTEEQVYNTAFSPDGQTLYGNEMNGKVQVWRAAAKQ